MSRDSRDAIRKSSPSARNNPSSIATSTSRLLNADTGSIVIVIIAIPSAPGDGLLRPLIPVVDVLRLLVRLDDRLLDVPALDQHPVHHAADDVRGEHFSSGGIHDARGWELPAALQHPAPVLEHRSLPELGVV